MLSPVLVLVALSLVSSGDCRDVVRLDCQDEGTSYHPHEVDCTRFYRCERGFKVTFFCPYGLRYDASRELCDSTTDVVCDTWSDEKDVFAEVTTERVTPMRTTTEVITTERVTPIRTTTERFTPIRTTTERIPMTSESNSSVENTTIQIITTSTIFNLPDCPDTPTCNAELGILKPYPPDCNSYIYCLEEQRFEIRHCEAGDNFSPTQLACLPPEEAKCPLCFA